MGSLHLVGGEKGGVGKSVVSRLLCQLFIDQKRAFVGFDGDASHPALLRYYAGYAQPVDLRSFEGCDAMLMAALNDTPVVVDMPAQSAGSVSRWIRESGVGEVAAEAGVQVVRWHVMDDGKDSLKLLQALVADLEEGVDLVVVRNFGRGSDFSWMATTPEFAAASEAGAMFIDLPGLHAPTMSKIDRMDASFWAACQNRDESRGPNLNLLESRRVRVWLQNAHAALVAAHPSLQPVARRVEPTQLQVEPTQLQVEPTQLQVEEDTNSGIHEQGQGFGPQVSN